MQYICEKCKLEKTCDDCKNENGKRQNVEGCGDFISKEKKLKNIFRKLDNFLTTICREIGKRG